MILPLSLRDFSVRSVRLIWREYNRQIPQPNRSPAAGYPQPNRYGTTRTTQARPMAPQVHNRVTNNRSRVTNGNALFVGGGVHAQSPWARRLRDIMQLHTADLGGADYISAAEASIVRRVATETVEMELLEYKFAKNGKGAASEDLDLYARISNSLRRHLEALGLKRVSRDVTPPTLDELARQFEAEEAADAADAAADGGVE
jgi:hypothetical protein